MPNVLSNRMMISQKLLFTLTITILTACADEPSLYPVQGIGSPEIGTGFPQTGVGYPQQEIAYPQIGIAAPEKQKEIPIEEKQEQPKIEPTEVNITENNKLPAIKPEGERTFEFTAPTRHGSD